MRILVQSIFYSPELTGVARYTAEMCEWLAAQGHHVEVVAPPPHYPQWRIQPPYRYWRYTVEHLRGVRVRRCPVWIPRTPSGLWRVIYGVSFMLSSFPAMLSALRGSPNVVISIEPPILGSVTAWLAARLGGASAWLHIQDFEIDLAYDLGQLRRARRLARAFESWVMRRFETVSSLTPRMLNRARFKGAAQPKLVLLPNWFDPSVLYPLREVSPMRAALGIDEGALVALFSGSLGAKQGLDVIIDAARLSGPGVVFVVCGEGVAAERLRERARGLLNVRFLPLQPASQLNDLLNLADVHLLPQDPCAADSVMPSKLIGMLGTGRPVIATALAGSDIAALIEDCGFCVAPGDASGIVRSLGALAQDAQHRIRLGRNARNRAVELFSANLILPALERELMHRAGDISQHPAPSFASE